MSHIESHRERSGRYDPMSMSRPPHIPGSIHHRVMFSDLGGCVPPQLITIEGPEAQHLARVKRARVGELVGVLDGRGAVGVGEIAEISGSKQRPIVAVMLDRVMMVGPTSPGIDICCPAPKGDRLERMIDQLTQIGVESWTPLVTQRSERDPATVRADRLERIIHEASKQCIRARALVVREPMNLNEAVNAQGSIRVCACDASGEGALSSEDIGSQGRVLIGPEGGWADDELALFNDTGTPICRLGVHVLRLESAAVVAASLVLCNARSPNPFGDE